MKENNKKNRKREKEKEKQTPPTATTHHPNNFISIAYRFIFYKINSNGLLLHYFNSIRNNFELAVLLLLLFIHVHYIPIFCSIYSNGFICFRKFAWFVICFFFMFCSVAFAFCRIDVFSFELFAAIYKQQQVQYAHAFLLLVNFFFLLSHCVKQSLICTSPTKNLTEKVENARVG